MKYLSLLMFVFCAFTFVACNETKQPVVPATPAPVQPPAAPVTDTSGTIRVTGKVMEIKMGKDGYTARLESEGNATIFATISRANLKDPSQYREVKTGETLEVEGEGWKMGDERQVTVRVLR